MSNGGGRKASRHTQRPRLSPFWTMSSPSETIFGTFNQHTALGRRGLWIHTTSDRQSVRSINGKKKKKRWVKSVKQGNEGNRKRNDSLLGLEPGLPFMPRTRVSG